MSMDYFCIFCYNIQTQLFKFIIHNMNKILASISLFIFAISSILPSSIVFATTADEDDINNIISDAEVSDYNSMTQVEIKNFLKSKNSHLANYWYFGDNPSPTELGIDIDDANRKIIPASEVPDFPKKRSATEIIWNAAIEFKINPKFLLVMLQKEQGLIEKSDPSERNLAYAMGYYCYDGQYCNFKWSGFGKQVRSTAEQFRYYIDNIERYDHQPNKRSCVDDPTPDLPCTSKGTEIKPANAITAAMYIYTPHVHGNLLFAKIWDRYDFGGASEPTVEELVKNGIFPHGALVTDEDDDTVYLIYNNKKRPFESTTALVSRYDPGKVLTVDSIELDKFHLGDPIKFANYSIFETLGGKKYLIDGLEKRLISSNEAFKALGFNPAEVEEIAAQELEVFETGAPLDAEYSPFSQLMRDTSTNGVYFVKDDKKIPIVDPLILEINYPDMKIVDVNEANLDKYKKVSAMRLEDGNLIKLEDDPRVYVISDGARRAIEDEATFLSLGYSWSDIHIVNERVMRLHPIGQKLKL